MDNKHWDSFDEAMHERLAGLSATPAPDAWASITATVQPAARPSLWSWLLLLGAVLLVGQSGVRPEYAAMPSHLSQPSAIASAHTSDAATAALPGAFWSGEQTAQTAPHAAQSWLAPAKQRTDLATVGSVWLAENQPVAHLKRPVETRSQKSEGMMEATEATKLEGALANKPQPKPQPDLPVQQAMAVATTNSDGLPGAAADQPIGSSSKEHEVGVSAGKSAVLAKPVAVAEGDRPRFALTEAFAGHDVALLATQSQISSSQRALAQLPSQPSWRLDGKKIKTVFPTTAYPTRHLYWHVSMSHMLSWQVFSARADDDIAFEAEQSSHYLRAGFSAGFRFEKPLSRHLYGYLGLGYQEVELGQVFSYATSNTASLDARMLGRDYLLINPNFATGQLAMPQRSYRTSLSVGLRCYFGDGWAKRTSENLSAKTVLRHSVRVGGSLLVLGGPSNLLGEGEQNPRLARQIWAIDLAYSMYWQLSRKLALLTGPQWSPTLQQSTPSQMPLRMDVQQLSWELGLVWQLR